MTTHADITRPLDLAETCLAAAERHAVEAEQQRHAGLHSAAGVEREQQRYYMKRAEIYLALSTATSLASIADDLAALRLAR